jgi:hypothetical protein
MNTTCTKCGQLINEIVTIGGLPYGTTCAQRVLGIKDFPQWFSGGDWDKEKKDYDTMIADNHNKFLEARAITSEFWSEWHTLSVIKQEAYKNHNDWLYEFMGSVITQLGYHSSLCNMPSTLEEAENDTYHSKYIAYLYNRPKRISELSPKQLSIINKYL